MNVLQEVHLKTIKIYFFQGNPRTIHNITPPLLVQSHVLLYVYVFIYLSSYDDRRLHLVFHHNVDKNYVKHNKHTQLRAIYA